MKSFSGMNSLAKSIWLKWAASGKQQDMRQRKYHIRRIQFEILSEAGITVYLISDYRPKWNKGNLLWNGAMERYEFLSHLNLPGSQRLPMLYTTTLREAHDSEFNLPKRYINNHRPVAGTGRVLVEVLKYTKAKNRKGNRNSSSVLHDSAIGILQWMDLERLIWAGRTVYELENELKWLHHSDCPLRNLNAKSYRFLYLISTDSARRWSAKRVRCLVIFHSFKNWIKRQGVSRFQKVSVRKVKKKNWGRFY